MGAKEIVESYWDEHFSRNWDEMTTFFSEDAHYTDIGLDAVGATGPDEIILRLRLGIEPLSGYVHFPKNMICEESFVVTEHLEQWQFHTGEIIDHPFTSVMEIDDAGLICRWHDYSHLGNLLQQAPTWWLEHIANGWRGQS